ncbi:putative Flagellar motor switch protein FliM [uncultured Desulfobacterium sp.]|uniref:Flagellar motor switch protein FliM n=1 Tax=uncultured Desulfobacterium sp. TaxID=201089 RepID=A0A445MTC1_9BACT|nr:putative Flagellar motor switch protein FliM [uncultured Desulfobacterium sp.]
MAEQILSQEEIDSLLGAMDKGELEIDLNKSNEPEIESYDITSQSIKLRDQFQALEEVYDKFATLLRSALSTTLQKSIGVEFISTEMVKFEEFMAAFSNPTNFTSFNMDPLIGSGLFAIEPSLVFSLIDCMFGGTGKPIEKTRDVFTQIELNLMRKFGVDVLECLEKAWEYIFPLKLSFKKIETKPEFVHLVAPSDLVIIVLFSIHGQEFSGNIHMCISYLMLEPIKEKLSSRYLRERDRESTWSAEISSLLGSAQICVSGELGRTIQSVQDILFLQIDDIIYLNNGPLDPVTIKVEDIPKYLGSPGTYKGNTSVQINNYVKRCGGVESHANN